MICSQYMTCASPVLYTKGTVLIFNPYVFVNYWDNMTGRRSYMIPLINTINGPMSQDGRQNSRWLDLHFYSGQRVITSFPRKPLNSHNSWSGVCAILVFTSEADFLAVIEPPASEC